MGFSMGLFLIMGGDITVAGRRHRNGSAIAFDGVPVPIGLARLDAEARKQKLESITTDILDNAARYPQRTMLLARSLGKDGSTPDRARRSIREWMAEQLQSLPHNQAAINATNAGAQ